MRKILRYPRDCFQIRWCIRGKRGIGRTHRHGLKGNWRRRGRDVASSAGRGLSQGNEIYDHGTPHRRGNFLGDKSLPLFLLYFQRTATRPVPRMEEPVSTFSDRTKPLSIPSSRIADYHIKWTEVFAVIACRLHHCCFHLFPYLLKNLMDHFPNARRILQILPPRNLINFFQFVHHR